MTNIIGPVIGYVIITYRVYVNSKIITLKIPTLKLETPRLKMIFSTLKLEIPKNKVGVFHNVALMRFRRNKLFNEFIH